MVTQQAQSGRTQGARQGAEADVTQALQPIMSHMQDQIQQIIQQQIDQALQPLRQGMAQAPGQTGSGRQLNIASSQSPQVGPPPGAAQDTAATQAQPQGQQEQQGPQPTDQAQAGQEQPVRTIRRVAMTNMKFKKQERLSRVEAADRLTEIAQALRNSGKFELERGGEEIKLDHIPDDVMLEFEVELEDGETELEVEIKWTSVASPAAST